ncbi:MAG: GAF domain-containing sensor histidine kinase [Chloroflexi bacterium]|nr:GAF domain-containing sensor histidine kinase [Chloroflexota bacterium]
MTLRTLKTIAVVAPAVSIGLIEGIRHTLLVEDESMFIGNVAILVVTLVGAFFFSRVVFGIIEGMQKELLRRNEELIALNSVAQAVSESLNLDVILYRALDKVLQVTAADAGEIFLLDEPTQELVQRVRAGAFIEALTEKTRFQIGEGLVGEAAASREPIVVEDISRDARLLRPRTRDARFHSLVCVPLIAKDAVVGVFSIFTLEPRRFTSEDVQLMFNTGHQIATAIENARLHERVQGIATLEERERIAREMHDGLAQVLSYFSVKTQAVQKFLSTGQLEQAEAHLKELEETAQEMYADVRDLILGLRSTTSFQRGMIPSLREYLARYSQIGTVKAELEIDDRALPYLPSDTEVQIMRIIQESLTNVRKHAKAHHAWVRITAEEKAVEIVVEDDGQGFDVAHIRRENRPKFGLQTMKERAEAIKGTLEIVSEPDRGTRVTLRVPQNQGAVT